MVKLKGNTPIIEHGSEIARSAFLQLCSAFKIECTWFLYICIMKFYTPQGMCISIV